MLSWLIRNKLHKWNILLYYIINNCCETFSYYFFLNLFSYCMMTKCTASLMGMMWCLALRSGMLMMLLNSDSYMHTHIGTGSLVSSAWRNDIYYTKSARKCAWFTDREQFLLKTSIFSVHKSWMLASFGCRRASFQLFAEKASWWGGVVDAFQFYRPFTVCHGVTLIYYSFNIRRRFIQPIDVGGKRPEFGAPAVQTQPGMRWIATTKTAIRRGDTESES